MKKLKQNVSGCSDQIPVDLLIEIFLRVSSKSIVRFRCVSKFWRSLLRRPNFTELFLTKSLARPLLLFAFQVVCFDVRSEIFSFIDKDEAMSIYYSCTLINYKGKLGVAKFTYGFHRFLELWILEDAGKHKWSKIIYEFSPLWKSIFDETSVHIIGLTGTGDIVFSAYFLSDPFYVFYYNLDSKTLTRTEIQGFEKFQNHRVYIFQEYVENVKPNLLT
ncbi:F-box protein At1g53790 [Eutrema salsugineum]|uniref:F-box protein At1g53790 n=1 Tax=Eutrema salsugineum TaxID=72664 RepID=UPI000CED52EB|nr:F-box protein At1g53790 [Eutrema salsugineum]